MEARSKKLDYLKRYAKKLKKSAQNSPENLKFSSSTDKTAKFNYIHHQLHQSPKTKSKFFSSKTSKSHLINQVSKSPSNISRLLINSSCKFTRKQSYLKNNNPSSRRNFDRYSPITVDYLSFVSYQEIKPRSVSPIPNIQKKLSLKTPPKRLKSIKVQIMNPESEDSSERNSI